MVIKKPNGDMNHQTMCHSFGLWQNIHVTLLNLLLYCFINGDFACVEHSCVSM